MGIDGISGGHVSLHEAAALARATRLAALSAPAASTAPASLHPPAPRALSGRVAPGSSRTFAPHTSVQSHADVDPDQWDGMLNRLGRKYNVPPLFLKAVMLSESGGRPDAVGDQGHSVGLFQLHDQGYGAGMGDRRFDPEINADRAVKGLAEAWRAGERGGLQGEQAVRAAYDYSFNPGGGWAYQGDSVVRNYNQLLREQGLPALRP